MRLGAGLLASDGHKVVASRAGRVKQGAHSKLTIDNAQKRVRVAATSSHSAVAAAAALTGSSHADEVCGCLCSPSCQYIPAAEDLVIGTVVERHVESYKLDIGGPEVSTADYNNQPSYLALRIQDCSRSRVIVAIVSIRSSQHFLHRPSKVQLNATNQTWQSDTSHNPPVHSALPRTRESTRCCRAPQTDSLHHDVLPPPSDSCTPWCTAACCTCGATWSRS